jgi:hypothetical protein
MAGFMQPQITGMQPMPQQPTGGGGSQFFGNLGSYAPLPYQAFGAIPQINPYLVQPGDIGQFLPGYSGAVNQAEQPFFQQQSDRLNQDLQSRGIFNSGAANAAQGNLLAQQYATTLGQSLPFAQQDIMGNVGAQNQANAANAATYGQITSGNQSLYNNFLNQLYGGNIGYGGGLLQSYLGSYDPSLYTGLLGQGLGQSGQAYSNAYNQGMAAAGPIGSAFGQLGQGIYGMFNHPSQPPITNPTGASDIATNYGTVGGTNPNPSDPFSSYPE